MPTTKALISMQPGIHTDFLRRSLQSMDLTVAGEVPEDQELYSLITRTGVLNVITSLSERDGRRVPDIFGDLLEAHARLRIFAIAKDQSRVKLFRNEPTVQLYNDVSLIALVRLIREFDAR